jgi:hypothetical protein
MNPRQRPERIDVVVGNDVDALVGSYDQIDPGEDAQSADERGEHEHRALRAAPRGDLREIWST